MKNKIFIFLIASLLFIPIFTRAFSDSDAILISVLVKRENEAENWSREATMVAGQNFDFLLIIKNNSTEPFKNVNLEIEIPREISYNGYLTINGQTRRENIKNPIALGVFLPQEQKTIGFQAKSQNLNFKDIKKEIVLKVFADNSKVLSSMPVVLKPYVFEGIKIERRIGLATVSLSLKQWYFWVIIIAALTFFFFRIFLKLFSTPMG